MLQVKSWAIPSQLMDLRQRLVENTGDIVSTSNWELTTTPTPLTKNEMKYFLLLVQNIEAHDRLNGLRLDGVIDKNRVVLKKSTSNMEVGKLITTRDLLRNIDEISDQLLNMLKDTGVLNTQNQVSLSPTAQAELIIDSDLLTPSATALVFNNIRNERARAYLRSELNSILVTSAVKLWRVRKGDLYKIFSAPHDADPREIFIQALGAAMISPALVVTDVFFNPLTAERVGAPLYTDDRLKLLNTCITSYYPSQLFGFSKNFFSESGVGLEGNGSAYQFEFIGLSRVIYSSIFPGIYAGFSHVIMSGFDNKEFPIIYSLKIYAQGSRWGDRAFVEGGVGYSISGKSAQVDLLLGTASGEAGGRASFMFLDNKGSFGRLRLGYFEKGLKEYSFGIGQGDGGKTFHEYGITAGADGQNSPYGIGPYISIGVRYSGD